MKICENCGHENWSYRTTCEKCNMSIYEKGAAANRPSFSKYTLAEKHVEERWYIDTGCTTAAKVIMIIATVGQALLTLLTFIIWIIFACLASRDDAPLESGIMLALFFSCLAVFFIGLTVSLIMTIVYYRKTANSKERVGMGFKICTLLFVNFIAGILMLLDKRDE